MQCPTRPVALAWLVLLASLNYFAGTPGRAEPLGFTLRDIEGREHRPFADAHTRAVALAFVLPDCPIANGYAPELERLHRQYAARGVRFFLVQVDPDLTPAESRKHAREYGYSCSVVLDLHHEWVQRAGAKRVPEIAVFVPDGTRAYRGRIDDLYVAPGRRRSQPTRHDVREALDAILAGRPVAFAETDSVGCLIPPLAKKDSR